MIHRHPNASGSDVALTRRVPQ